MEWSCQGELSADDFRRLAQKFREHTTERFYADLYLGLFLASQGERAAALKDLKAAEENRWARSASGGPGWMWHIARIHADKIRREQADAKKPATPTSGGPAKKEG